MALSKVKVLFGGTNSEIFGHTQSMMYLRLKPPIRIHKSFSKIETINDKR